LERLPRLCEILTPEFSVELWDRIQVADTDLSGVIYFDRYYRRAEAGYAELVRASGASFREMMTERFVTPAVSSRCDYFQPATLDDRIRQVATVSRIGTSSQSSDHHFLLEDGIQLATVRITRAIVNAETRETASVETVLRETPDSHLARFLRAARVR
jgi:YbgC/YbaW family acyl-CoA thioester hydrolase